MIPIIWHTREPGTRNRGYFDQGWLEDIINGQPHYPRRAVFNHYYGFDDADPFIDGAVVVIPARHFVTDLEAINTGLAKLRWTLVILTCDEEGKFPHHELSHPNMKLWVQTPYPDRHGNVDMRLPDFSPPNTLGFLADLGPDRAQSIPWSFVGQNNNARRAEAISALRPLTEPDLEDPAGVLIPTPGFTLGLPRTAYLGILASSQVIPAPSGCFTPDTFRAFEALDAGCVPIVDTSAPETGPVDYWSFLFGSEPPFPIIENWSDVDTVMDPILADFPASAVRVSAWWQSYKRHLVERFYTDVEALSGVVLPAPSPISVVIPSSPIPSHPSPHILQETIASVRRRLPDAPIYLLLDGCREEQAHLRDAYLEYQRRVLFMCNVMWVNVYPIVHETHRHQSGMMRHILGSITSDLLLFVEHDCPLVGEIPFERLSDLLIRGDLDLIRLYPEASIPDEHGYLMVDRSPSAINSVPIVRTRQWSQRPHLARVDYYRKVMSHFTDNERWMIEDRMHSIVQRQRWAENRIGIYAPPDDMKRSAHLDGREHEPKWVDS